MEVTGGYEVALACALQATGLRVAVVSMRKLITHLNAIVRDHWNAQSRLGHA